MADNLRINTVATEDDYIHVQFREPNQFDEIRTPDWASNAAQSVSDDAKVRTGKREDSNDWMVESVLLEKHIGEEKAREQATDIIEKIES
ncbi:hypothetical protein [Halocatena marina]|uniref:Uncharacterized protein n=1 Tax=Halocatena marina TaxID=2934937 RepID=A0ABD5YL63_9EURY|nr:hypothetical protein [Halocatena marina]